MRWFVAALLLAALLVVADRLAVRAAEDAVATRLATAGGLSATPEVELRGTPFLTQALRGRYDDVVVRASDVPAGTLRAESFVAQLRGVRVPLSDVVGGTVEAVPVDQLTARAVLGFDALTSAVADRGLRVTAAEPGLLRVTGSLTVLGRTVEASAISRPTLEDGEVVVTAERFEVGGTLPDAALSRALGNRLDFRVDVAALPYGLTITDLRATTAGVVLAARSDGPVLRTGG